MTDTPPPPPPPAMPPPPSGGYGSGGGTPAMANPLVGYWKKCVLENYANFQGRARRSEFWWFYLANILALIVCGILIQISGIFWVLYVAYALAILVPGIAVTVRRLHDTDKSGWFILFGLIPFVGGIILLVFMVLDSTRGTNMYGTSEKYPA